MFSNKPYNIHHLDLSVKRQSMDVLIDLILNCVGPQPENFLAGGEILEPFHGQEPLVTYANAVTFDAAFR